MDVPKNTAVDSVKIDKKLIGTCLMQVDYTVSASKVEETFNKVAKEFAKYIKLDGFRPGKVPFAMVKNLRKKEIEKEALERLISELSNALVNEKKEDIITMFVEGQDKLNLELGKDLNFILKCDIAPEIKVPEYKGIVLELVERDPIDIIIDSRIEFFKNLFGTYEKVEDGAGKDDIVKVSYTSDFKLPENASKEEEMLGNCENRYIHLADKESVIPTLNEKLSGAKEGDVIELKTEFPSDFKKVASFAGKSIKYEVKVLEVTRKMPLKSDEELCKKLGVESMESLKDSLKNKIQNEDESALKAEKFSKILEFFSKDLDFDVPPNSLETLSGISLREIMNEKLKDIKDKEEAKKEFEEKKVEFMDEARQRAAKELRKDLFFRKIGQLENIELEQTEIEGLKNELKYKYGYSEKEVLSILNNPTNFKLLTDGLLTSKVINFIADNAKIEYVTKTK